MCAKDRGVNTGDPRQCGGASHCNRRSARIGAGLNWESERFVVAMKRVMIVERRDLSSRATLEVTRGKRLAFWPSNALNPRPIQMAFKRLKRRWSWVSPCARALSPLSESWMQEICPSSLMSGIWKRRHGQIFRHRQPKGSGTVKAGPTSTAPDLDSTLSRGFPHRPRVRRHPIKSIVRVDHDSAASFKMIKIIRARIVGVMLSGVAEREASA